MSQMRLMYGALSPFVRKVMIAAHEKGIVEQLELVPSAVGAGKVNAELMAINPVGKIPALVGADGTVVHDSSVIVDYFDTVAPEPRLIPHAGPARTQALRMNATADGLLVAGVLARTELSRPEAHRWMAFHDAQMTKLRQCLLALDAEIAAVPEGLTLGHIATGAALGWLDFRLQEEDWRSTCPGLAAWYTTFAQRDSMQQTAPR